MKKLFLQRYQYVYVDKEVFDKRKHYSQLRDIVNNEGLEKVKIYKALGDKIENVKVFDFIDHIDAKEGGKCIFSF